MYQLVKNRELQQNVAITRLLDGASIPFDPANTDYQAYLAWCAEGNEPLAADAPADQPTE